MAEFSNKSGLNNERMPHSVSCEVCEAMCPDAVDGALTAAEQQAFDRHVGTCAVCAEHLAEAQRGAAWMEMLKSHRPAPSSDLLAKILAQTSGAPAASESLATASETRLSVAKVGHPVVVAASASAAVPSAIVTLPNGKLGIAAGMLPGARAGSGSWVYAGLQPRLAMTAAMAFFSLALTLNVLGVRLSDLHPDSLRHTANDARMSVVRKFENNRTVYQMESRVSDLREGQGQ